MDGKRFARSRNATIFGVCAGLADYSGLGVGAMRFIWVLFAIFTGLFPAFATYVVLAIVMAPPEGAPQGDRFWHHVEGRSVMMVLALTLMCLGCYILVDRVFHFNLMQYFFPVVLIVIGALLFAFAFGGNKRQQ